MPRAQQRHHTDGTPVVIRTCTGADFQRWTYQLIQHTYTTAGKCLDATRAATDNGT